MSSRTRRALALRPIHSEKKETTWTFLAQNASTIQTITLVNAVRTPSTGVEVNIGSIVKWLYIETNLNGVDNSSGAQIFHFQIYKSPNNQLGNIDPSIYDAVTKKWVLKRGMDMLPDIPLGSGGTVQTKRVMVIRIPKKMQRMGDNDKIILTYKSTSASGLNYCGFSIFKELI